MKTLFKTVVMTGILAGMSGPAMAEVVVVVNPKCDVASMSSEQVAQFFLGKSSTMVPIDQPESAAIRAEFYTKVAGKGPAQVKALWSKLVFTGAATLPREVASSADVKKAVAADPNAIGYIERSALDATVKVVHTAP